MECDAPAWLNSRYVRKLDTQLNRTMLYITGCIMPTPAYWFTALSHFALPYFRRQGALVHQYRKIPAEPQLPSYLLKSRTSPVKTAFELCENDLPIFLISQFRASRLVLISRGKYGKPLTQFEPDMLDVRICFTNGEGCLRLFVTAWTHVKPQSILSDSAQIEHPQVM